MIVKQIWTNNDFRNFNYIIACPSTGEALAIDPLDYNKCLSVSKNNGFEITQILNTHHHHDHIGGNSDIIRQTGAKLLAHAEAKNEIPDIDIGLSAGDTVSVGKLVDLEVLDTPGHTMSHVCLLSHTDQPALFCGDTCLTRVLATAKEEVTLRRFILLLTGNCPNYLMIHLFTLGMII